MSIRLLKGYIEEYGYCRQLFLGLDTNVPVAYSPGAFGNLSLMDFANEYYIVQRENFSLIKVKDHNYCFVESLPRPYLINSVIRLLYGYIEQSENKKVAAETILFIYYYYVFYKSSYKSSKLLTSTELTDALIRIISDSIQILIEKSGSTYNEIIAEICIEYLQERLLIERIQNSPRIFNLRNI